MGTYPHMYPAEQGIRLYIPAKKYMYADTYSSINLNIQSSQKEISAIFALLHLEESKYGHTYTF